jgi:hypothetical protein
VGHAVVGLCEVEENNIEGLTLCARGEHQCVKSEDMIQRVMLGEEGVLSRVQADLWREAAQKERQQVGGEELGDYRLDGDKSVATWERAVATLVHRADGALHTHRGKRRRSNVEGQECAKDRPQGRVTEVLHAESVAIRGATATETRECVTYLLHGWQSHSER